MKLDPIEEDLVRFVSLVAGRLPDQLDYIYYMLQFMSIITRKLTPVDETIAKSWISPQLTECHFLDGIRIKSTIGLKS